MGFLERAAVLCTSTALARSTASLHAALRRASPSPRPYYERHRQHQPSERRHDSSAGNPGPLDIIRRQLTEGAVRAMDRRALFVGVDAYEAAGGVPRNGPDALDYGNATPIHKREHAGLAGASERRRQAEVPSVG